MNVVTGCMEVGSRRENRSQALTPYTQYSLVLANAQSWAVLATWRHRCSHVAPTHTASRRSEAAVRETAVTRAGWAPAASRSPPSSATKFNALHEHSSRQLHLIRCRRLLRTPGSCTL